MTKAYSVQRTINAPIERIWGLLTDADSYSAWNSAVLGIEGKIAEGEKIELRSTVDPKRTFKLTVVEMEAPRAMVWADGMPLGLFKGRRTFRLDGADGEAVSFSMREEFSGPLAPLITKVIPDLTDSFEQFGDSLQQAAESE